MQYELFQNANVKLYYSIADLKWRLYKVSVSKEYDLSINSNLSCFLEIFYEEPALFFKKVSNEIEKRQLPPAIIKDLPFKKAILFSADNRMFFWLELSLKWIGFLDIDLTFKNALEKITRDSFFPQNVRHKLQQELRNRE